MRVSAPVIGFVSTRHGIGKTTLIYTLGWMYASLGWRVLLADLDPQADLTVDFLFAGVEQELWRPPHSRAAANWGTSDLHSFENGPFLLAGDPGLAAEEDGLARAWIESTTGSAEARGRIAAVSERVRRVARDVDAQVVLVDLSPSLGALNRAALVGCDRVIVTVTRDVTSSRLLPAVRRALDAWRQEWRERASAEQTPPALSADSPTAGYVVLGRGHARVMPCDEPLMYSLVEDVPVAQVLAAVSKRSTMPNCLGVVKDYPALVELAREAGKPMFALKAADGAIGAHAQLVVEAYRNFREIAEALAERCGLPPRPGE